jgi:hypothetical protein
VSNMNDLSHGRFVSDDWASLSGGCLIGARGVQERDKALILVLITAGMELVYEFVVRRDCDIGESASGGAADFIRLVGMANPPCAVNKG